MSLTIHLGAHKTASTHLQRTLRELVPQLLRAGVLYSDIHHWRGGAGRLMTALADGPAAARYRGRLARRLDVAADHWPEIVISEENILGSLRRDGLMGPDNTLYPQAVRRLDRLCAMVRRRPATLCLAVREPMGFLGSAFSMQVQGGHELVFQDYLSGFDPAALSWSELVARLLSVRGVARVVVWRFEDYASVRPAILGRLMPARIAAMAEDAPPALVGLSQRAFDAIVARMASDPGADQIAVARQAKAEHPRAEDAGPLVLCDPVQQARCNAAYRADVERLARMDGVTVLVP